MRSPSASLHKASGLSLVEVLIVISVIGLIAAIAIPQVSDISDGAKETVARRNASELASLSSGLAGAGMSHVIPESLGGVEATCRLLKRGVTVTEGTLSGSVFSMPGIDNEQIPLAASYLDVFFESLSILQLIYLQDGNDVAIARNAEKQREALIKNLNIQAYIAEVLLNAAEEELKDAEDALDDAEDALKEAEDLLKDAEDLDNPDLLNNAEALVEAAELAVAQAEKAIEDKEKAIEEAEIYVDDIKQQLSDAE